MHMADSLWCTTETNTVLWSNYTPIKIYLKNRIKNNYELDQGSTNFFCKGLLVNILGFAGDTASVTTTQTVTGKNLRR